MLYDAFFVPPKKPAIGDKESECIAVVAIRNPAGSVVRYHALLSEAQWSWHKKNNGAKGFDAEKLFVGKEVESKDSAGATITKISPVHFFYGRPVVDGDARMAYTDKFGLDRALEESVKEVQDVAEIGIADSRVD